MGTEYSIGITRIVERFDLGKGNWQYIFPVKSTEQSSADECFFSTGGIFKYGDYFVSLYKT